MAQPILGSLWDPRAVLGIDMARCLCIGKAENGGRDCEAWTGKRRKNKAKGLLNELAMEDPEDSVRATTLCREIAHELLCGTHQSQISDIIDNWKKRYEQYQEQQAVHERQNQSQPVDAAPATSENQDITALGALLDALTLKLTVKQQELDLQALKLEEAKRGLHLAASATAAAAAVASLPRHSNGRRDHQHFLRNNK